MLCRQSPSDLPLTARHNYVTPACFLLSVVTFIRMMREKSADILCPGRPAAPPRHRLVICFRVACTAFHWPNTSPTQPPSTPQPNNSLIPRAIAPNLAPPHRPSAPAPEAAC